MSESTQTNFIKAATLDEIAEGTLLSTQVDGKEVVLARIDGTIYGIDGFCNHGLAYLGEGELEGHNIVCPLHGGCFDVRTGAATREPCVEPLDSYPIRISGKDILVCVG